MPRKMNMWGIEKWLLGRHNWNLIPRIEITFCCCCWSYFFQRTRACLMPGCLNAPILIHFPCLTYRERYLFSILPRGSPEIRRFRFIFASKFSSFPPEYAFQVWNHVPAARVEPALFRPTSTERPPTPGSPIFCYQ